VPPLPVEAESSQPPPDEQPTVELPALVDLESDQQPEKEAA
jgi:hypothetical protein